MRRLRSHIPLVTSSSLGVVGCALLIFNPTSHAAIDLGNYGALALELEAAAKYSSNISQNSAEESDFITQVRPFVKYRFAQGDINIDAYAGMNYLFYKDNDENDAEDFKSNLTVSYPGGDYDYETRYDWVFDASFEESTSPNASVQQITSTEELRIDFSGRYFVTENVYLRSGFLYRDLDSMTAGLEDIDQWGVPLEIFYKYSDKLNFGFGYSYMNTDVTDAAKAPEADSQDHAYYLAAEGQIAPSMTATLRGGIQERKFDDQANFDDSDGAFVDASIIWEVSEQTRVGFKAGSAFDTTIDNESVETVFTEVEFNHIFNEKISAALAIGYEESEYDESVDGREDELIYSNFGLVYSLIEDRLTLKVSSSYDDRSSTRATSDYDAFTFEVELKYLF